MKTFIHALTKLSTNRQMIVTANTEPIALSIVEGCAQSTRSNVEDWNTGVLEWWNNGVKHLKPNTLIFQYSNTPFHSSAPEIFLSSLQFSVFQQPVRRHGDFCGEAQEPECAMGDLSKLRRLR